jgi:hypothetical protein
MKKLAIILSLICVLLFSGCSCGGKVALQFDSKWGENKIGYTEILNYDVSYAHDYSFGGYDFSRNNTLPDLSVSVDGEYVVKNEIVSLTGDNLPETVKNSPLTTGMPYIIKSITALYLTATYDFRGTQSSSTDVIYTEAYFCPSESSLSPISSYEKYDYSLLYVTDEVTLTKTVGENTITYSQDNYEVTQKVLNAETGEKVTETQRTYDYEVKTIIDNSSLLFGIRNLNFSTVKEFLIPTVHATYGEAQDLSVTYFEDSDITLDVSVNGELKQGLTVATRAVKYLISSSDKSGANQLVFVQNGGNELPDKSLIVRYVSPFSDYSAYRKAGALIYDLKSIDYYS